MDLPAITEIEPTATVGDRDRPAAVIWFGEKRALRYVHDPDVGCVLEQTYYDGITFNSYPVGDPDIRPAQAALDAVGEYLTEYKNDPEKMGDEWPHVHELLTA